MAQCWTSERLYFDGDAYYADCLTAIGDAKSSLILETYIFDPDEIGAKFEEALLRASARGVSVKLLVDGIGAANWIERRARTIAAAGVGVRIYHPLKFSALFRRVLIDFGFRRRSAKRTSAFVSRMNRRDHRKMLIVDEQVAWVGSLNISSVHSRSAMGPLAWRDTAARVEGEGIQALKAGFEYAWVRSHSPRGKRRWRDVILSRELKLHKIRSPVVRSNFTIGLRRDNFSDFASRLQQASRRVWITNAYLAPSRPMLNALVLAAQRGVDVRILVPRTSDVFFMPWVSASYYGHLLGVGVSIFEFLPRFLHAKSVIIDDWCAVGTSNLNRRSLLKDFEVDVVLQLPASLQALEKQFAIDLRESEQVRLAPRGLRAHLGRLIGYFMKRWI